MKYVLVQHSAYGYNSRSDFKGGLEVRSVTDKCLTKLADVGMPVYDTYGAADAAGYSFMYPPGVEGCLPVADRVGSFHRKKVDGLRLFVPNAAT